MAIQIISAFFFIAAVAVLILNYYSRSPFLVIHMGHPYALKNETVEAVVASYYWSVDGQYWILCHTTDDAKDEIRLPASDFSSPDNKNGPTEGETICLVRLKTVDGVVYTAPKQSPRRFILSQHNVTQLDCHEAERYDSQCKGIFVVSFLSAVISLFLIEDSSMSIAFSAVCIITQILFCPHLNWKNCNRCSIIRKIDIEPKKGEKGNGSDLAAEDYPLGYEHWSETRKQLFQMDIKAQRTHSATKDPESTVVDIPEASLDAGNSPSNTDAEEEATGAVPESKPQKPEAAPDRSENIELIGIEPGDYDGHQGKNSAVQHSQENSDSAPKTVEPASGTNISPNVKTDSATRNRTTENTTKKRGKKAQGHRRRAPQNSGSDVGKIIQGIDSTSL